MENNVEIDANLCTGCGACVSMCPVRILAMDKKTGTAKVMNASACDRLGGCMNVCPTGAIRVKTGNPFARMFGY